MVYSTMSLLLSGFAFFEFQVVFKTVENYELLSMTSAHARTAHTSLTFRGHNNNAVLQVKTSVTVGMAILVNLGAGMDLARGERFECVKKRVLSRNNKFL